MTVQYYLPDGATLEFDAPASGLDIAARISKKLAKQALAVRTGDTLRDIYLPLEEGSTVEIVTRDNEADALELIRHDAAHVMAEAVQELFDSPDDRVQVTIGPTIENGFYYDFHRDTPFTDDDLEAIEKRMKDIVRRNEAIRREVWDRDEAVQFFLDQGEEFKAEIIRDLPADQEVSLYRQGDFIDLCRGPHLPATSKLGDGFKLTKVAGAYWRGDSNREQLQRIYGTAWRDKKELKTYLNRLAEAERRDHRKLSKEMDLFHLQEEAPGMVFWHPRGWAVWQKVEAYVRKVYHDSGYQEVKAPSIMDVSLWQKSGHWDNYQENMFFTESEKRTYAVKPMNCPGHVQIYNAHLHSYRDLPIRLAEFGGCHRNEPSGALHGLMRVRAFTQDDGHIFCTPEQVESEVTAFHKQAMKVYDDFGFTDIDVKLALRPTKRIGSDAVWDKSEEALRNALASAGVEWEELPDEGAFYGPKVEYHLRDSLGRDWQMGTVQVDFMMPERLEADYVDENSQRQHPVMLHRAIVGSMERFIGILIEHYAGHLPLWLAPVPVKVCTITNQVDDYAREVCDELRANGIAAELDMRNEKIGYKVREHSKAKIPVIYVIGEKEASESKVAVRRLGSKETQVLDRAESLQALIEETRMPA